MWSGSAHRTGDLPQRGAKIPAYGDRLTLPLFSQSSVEAVKTIVSVYVCDQLPKHLLSCTSCALFQTKEKSFVCQVLQGVVIVVQGTQQTARFIPAALGRRQNRVVAVVQ